MKKLSKILRPIHDGFPVLGEDGYAGEQDKTRVVFLGVLCIPSRKEAEKIELGDAIGIHWAEYVNGEWRVSLAYWSDADEDDCFVRHTEGEKIHFI